MFQAFIEFLTDLFAALSEFLGGSLPVGDILEIIKNLTGGNSEDAPETDEN